MDKLEQYLDRVCRGVAGPRALRLHLRQELREHLLDAAAEYEAGGMGGEAAMEKALADFGGPEQVRSELEELHGHRLLGVVIDKAMQWKELTMKAKWFWATWAHLMLLMVIALEILFVALAMVFVVPKFRQMVQEGWMGGERHSEHELLSWAVGVINGVMWLANWGWWILAGVAVCWLVFEWKNHGEHKGAIRLALLGSGALGMLVVVLLLASAMILPPMVAIPELVSRPPEVVVGPQLVSLDESIAALEQARTRRDWKGMQEQSARAYHAAEVLSHMGGAASAIMTADQPAAKLEELRSRLRSIADYLRVARNAAFAEDPGALDGAMERLHRHYPLPAAPTTRWAP